MDDQKLYTKNEQAWNHLYKECEVTAMTVGKNLELQVCSIDIEEQ